MGSEISVNNVVNGTQNAGGVGGFNQPTINSDVINNVKYSQVRTGAWKYNWNLKIGWRKIARSGQVMAMTMALHRNFHWPMLGLALLLAACGGAIPTAEERRSEQEVAGYNQIMCEDNRHHFNLSNAKSSL